MIHHKPSHHASLATLLFVAALAPTTDVHAQYVVTPTSIAAGGASMGNAASLADQTAIADAAVVFTSRATDLTADVVPAGVSQVYVREESGTSLISRSPSGQGGNADSSASAVSADGRFVVFLSRASDLVAGYVNAGNPVQVFLADRLAGTIVLVSGANGSTTQAANAGAVAALLSEDGLVLAFESSATNLTADPVMVGGQVFVRASGVLSLVSGNATGTAAGNGVSRLSGLSANGGFVLMRSFATNLVSGVSDTNSSLDGFLRDRATGITSLVSRNSAGTGTGNAVSTVVAMSRNGSHVLLQSRANNLVAGTTDAANNEDVFRWRRSNNSMVLVSHEVALPLQAANNNSGPSAISDDGTLASYYSLATNLTSLPDTNTTEDVFVWREAGNANTLVSVNSAGTAAANGQSLTSRAAASGRVVPVYSTATNLIAGLSDTNSAYDAFAYDTASGSLRLLSRNAAGTGTADAQTIPVAVSISGDAIALRSDATNLVDVLDGNAGQDVFLAALPDLMFGDGFEDVP